MQHRLIWFRDDLRLDDNAAVFAALESLADAKVSAVFLTAETDWHSFGIGPNRLYYTEQLLRSLADRLAALGIPFSVERLSTFDDQVRWLIAYCSSHQVSDLYFNDEYPINERRRDEAVVQALKPHTRVHRLLDRLLIQAGQVLTQDGRPYSVFTPFKRRFWQVLHGQDYRPYPLPRAPRPACSVAQWAPICDQADSDLSEFAMTEAAAQASLAQFMQTRVQSYTSERNRPDRAGTSRLSPYLARGLLSPRQVIAAAEAARNAPIAEGSDDLLSFVSELIWREFYHHLLVGFPRLSKNQAFKPETEAIQWRSDPDEIHAWETGQTGIPIVDAGMRELRATGWMHNRVRMVVAQFLTKNLLVDWRVGERVFMHYLIDSDLAANNGGWQWSASTGTDAAPYFRVFNPVSQGQTHDPDAGYISHWIPELRAIPVSKRHAPWTVGGVSEYPKPLVDLTLTRKRAIDAFKDLS